MTDTYLVSDGIPLVEFRFAAVASQIIEPQDYIREIEGAIRLLMPDDRSLEAGRMTLFRADLGAALNNDMDRFAVLDSHSQNVADYLPLFDQDSDSILGWNQRLFARGQDPCEMDLLILDYMEIVPIHRGKGLALLAARAAAEVLGAHCGLAALKCQQAGLRKYWARLGFEIVLGTDLMIWNLSVRWPKIEQVLSGIRTDKV